ncbi:hypothetical protein PTKIN_Ptkin05aG0218900 [Pterospermum kingtungense]
MPMPLIPEGWEEKLHIAYFGESGDHLRLVQKYQPYLTQFDVYKMETDYSGWFVKYHVLPSLPSNDHPSIHFLLHRVGTTSRASSIQATNLVYRELTWELSTSLFDIPRIFQPD